MFCGNCSTLTRLLIFIFSHFCVMEVIAVPEATTVDNSSFPSLRPVVKETINIGLICPGTDLFLNLFIIRRANMYISQNYFLENEKYVFNFVNYFNVNSRFISSRKSVNDVIPLLCDDIFPHKINVIFIASFASFQKSTNFNRYFFELISYSGIPVFSLDSNTVEFDKRDSKNYLMQMTPSLAHQSSAMFSILERHSWKEFSMVTSNAVGHRDFIRAVNNQLNQRKYDSSWSLLASIVVNPWSGNDTMRGQLTKLRYTETRVVLLYAMNEEAKLIFQIAGELGLVGTNYVWIVAQLRPFRFRDSQTGHSFPVGTLGIYFNTAFSKVLAEIERAALVLGHGLELFVNDGRNNGTSLLPNLSCNTSDGTRWQDGETFVRYLRNVSFNPGDGEQVIAFIQDGTLKNVNLTIVNLIQDNKWEPCGFWTPAGLTLNVTVWPGNSQTVPSGKPVNPHLKIAFLEEPPFIFLSKPDKKSGNCSVGRQVDCYMSDKATNSSNSTLHRCCSGLMIDVLKDFAMYLDFTYDLNRVEDGIWGKNVDGQWNGLVGVLVDRKADLVLTSFSINSERAQIVDFTIPFMDTGIAVVVAKKTGIISTKAFLEPFDTLSWVMILLVSLHIATFAIFIFERQSPFGYDGALFHSPRDKKYKFSLLRTYWMVWADLFRASVSVDCPRSISARVMTSAWAMFAIVFVAIYTANLATFMITREDYHNLSGVKDERLLKPFTLQPPFRFGTVPHGNTETILRNNHPEMHSHMQQYSRKNATEGVKAVKKGELDAFIYDAMTLNYLAGQDVDCKLLTVGSWYAATGYGFAFPRKSRHLGLFNRFLMVYKEYGMMDRLQRYWMYGKCHPDNQRPKFSEPINLAQFTSVFIMLGLGIALAVIVFLLEMICFKYYFRKNSAKKDEFSKKRLS